MKCHARVSRFCSVYAAINSFLGRTFLPDLRTYEGSVQILFLVPFEPYRQKTEHKISGEGPFLLFARKSGSAKLWR